MLFGILFLSLSVVVFLFLLASLVFECAYVAARIALGYYRTRRSGLAVLVFFILNTLIVFAGAISIVIGICRLCVGTG